MKFYLIRHGRTDWNDLNHIQGKSDIPLNEKGIKQAHDLANKIRMDNLPIKHIYTSPLIRATQTASIISEAINIPYHTLDGLREVDLGDWEGLTWEDIAVSFPENYNEWYVERRYTKACGGESYNDMLIRTLDTLKGLASIHNEDTAIVSHSAVIMALMCYINNAPFTQMRSYKPANASITVIDSSELV